MLTTLEVARLFGLRFHTVHYWAKSGLVTPTVEASGRGSRRGWSVDDACKVGFVAAMRDAGVPTQRIRDVVESFDVSKWRNVLDAEAEFGVFVSSGVVWVDVAGIRERVERAAQLGFPGMDAEGGG